MKCRCELRKCIALSLLGVLFLLASITANASVPALYREIAQQFGIRADVLYAIALTESRVHLGGNIVRPWPWTVNVEGKPYYFKTRQEMTAFLQGCLRQGNRKFDVGLMQLSWRHHGKRFARLEDAIEPRANIQAGADYLRYLVDRTGSLKKAIGMYHTGEAGPIERQLQYRQAVNKALRQIGAPAHE